VRVDELTIELDGSPVFYRSAAGGRVGPIYLHGVPTSSDDWIPFLERTGGIAPDLIGFGRSSKAGNLDYTLDGLSDFLERFLDYLQIERVQLVGHDWGAAAGLVLAQRHPGLVERIVLLNAVPLLDAGFRWHRFARVWRSRALGELAMGATTKWLLGRSLRAGSVSAQAWPDDRIDAVWQQFDQGTQRAILRLYRAADERRLTSAGAGLGVLDVPARVIWGQRDPWLAPALGEAYADALPQATLERVPDAGHWPWLDQPELIERVAQFLGSA
jgi:pimeloyl-ACP methyl ester carboxylesterase